MSNKYDNVRIQHKREISADWAAASGFVPLDGELIVYKADDENPVPRLKIGNGVDNVNDLPFTTKDLATETYVTNAVSQKSQVQIITWEDDD